MTIENTQNTENTTNKPKAKSKDKAAPSAPVARAPLSAADKETEIAKALGFEYEFIDLPEEFKDAPVVEISPKALWVSKVDARSQPLSADEDMIESVKTNGLFQDPLATYARNRKTGAVGWLAVAGRRRREAADKAGLKVINCKVRRIANMQEYLLAAGTENLQRENMSPWDIYTFMKNLMTAGIPQGKLTEQVKKSEGFVSQYMAIGKLDERVQEMVRKAAHEPFKSGSITVIRELKRISDPELQVAFATKAVDEKMSPKDLKNLIDVHVAKQQAAGKEKPARGGAAKLKLPDEIKAADFTPLKKPDMADLLNAARVKFAKAKASESTTEERRQYLKGQVDGMLQFAGLRGGKKEGDDE